MTRARLNILFSGMIAADPHQGGATWAVLQYLLGFRRLGHRALLVEPVKPSSLRPAGTTLAAEATTHDALATVGNRRGDGSGEHQRVFYGQKAHSLRRFMTLPTRTRERFLLALAIHPGERGDLEALAANGWQLLDPAVVAGSP